MKFDFDVDRRTKNENCHSGETEVSCCYFASSVYISLLSPPFPFFFLFEDNSVVNKLKINKGSSCHKHTIYSSFPILIPCLSFLEKHY